MIYYGTVNKSPCHFSRSRETLERIGAVGISPVFYGGELPISITINRNNGTPSMEVKLVGGNR